MKAEELTQPEAQQEGLNFDAHEFDGLRTDIESYADTLLARADRFVRENPWLSIAIALGAGFGVGYLLRSASDSPSEDTSEE